MLYFKLAFRNVFRTRRRSFFTIGCIAAGICAILVIGGYYEYNYYGLRESLINSHYAHVQLYKTGYLGNEESDPFTYLIDDYREIIDFLLEDPDVVVATPRLTVWGVLNKLDSASEVVQIRGIVPDNEKFINLFVTQKIGDELDSESFDKMVVGYTLARNLGLKLNEEAILTTVTADGAQNAWQLKVGGIIGSYSAELDSILVKIPIAIAQELVSVYGVQQIVILLSKTSLTKSYMKKLREIIREKGWDLEMTSWYDLSGYYKQVVAYYSGYLKILLFITGIITFFTTLNTVMMTVFEKITEIGTMRSFGLTKSRIIRILINEAFILGLLGWGFGMGLSYLVAYLINRAGGIFVAPPPGVAFGFNAEILIVPNNILVVTIIALVVPLLATLIPAYRANKMEIIEQINYNDVK